MYEIDIFDTLMRDTQHLTTGTPKDKMNLHPIWSADGKSLWTGAFHTKHGWRFAGLESFAFLNIDLNGRVTATLGKGNVSFYWAISSSDGRHLALAAATDSANVLLLQNF